MIGETVRRGSTLSRVGLAHLALDEYLGEDSSHLLQSQLLGVGERHAVDE